MHKQYVLFFYFNSQIKHFTTIPLYFNHFFINIALENIHHGNTLNG